MVEENRKPIETLTEHHFKSTHLIIQRFERIENLLNEILNKLNKLEEKSCRE